MASGNISNQFLFSDKVALITGSGGGIGKAAARAFCQQGARVMLNGRNLDKLESACAELRAEGYTVAYCQADVTDIASCRSLIKATLDTFGRLDVLVTNASVSFRAKFEDAEPDVLKQVIDSQVYGTVLPLKAALGALKSSRGSVVLVSSLSALYGLPGGSAYSMGKMALTALAQSLRVEMAEHGLHIGLLRVGFTANDPGKRVLNADGTWTEVAPRKQSLQLSQEEVGRAIVKMAHKRQKQVTLSMLGKVMDLIVRFSPTLADRLVWWSSKRFRHMYY